MSIIFKQQGNKYKIYSKENINGEQDVQNCEQIHQIREGVKKVSF